MEDYVYRDADEDVYSELADATGGTSLNAPRLSSFNEREATNSPSLNHLLPVVRLLMRFPSNELFIKHTQRATNTAVECLASF